MLYFYHQVIRGCDFSVGFRGDRFEQEFKGDMVSIIRGAELLLDVTDYLSSVLPRVRVK